MIFSDPYCSNYVLWFFKPWQRRDIAVTVFLHWFLVDAYYITRFFPIRLSFFHSPHCMTPTANALKVAVVDCHFQSLNTNRRKWREVSTASMCCRTVLRHVNLRWSYRLLQDLWSEQDTVASSQMTYRHLSSKWKTVHDTTTPKYESLRSFLSHHTWTQANSCKPNIDIWYFTIFLTRLSNVNKRVKLKYFSEVVPITNTKEQPSYFQKLVIFCIWLDYGSWCLMDIHNSLPKFFCVLIYAIEPTKRPCYCLVPSVCSLDYIVRRWNILASSCAACCCYFPFRSSSMSVSNFILGCNA